MFLQSAGPAAEEQAENVTATGRIDERNGKPRNSGWLRRRPRTCGDAVVLVLFRDVAVCDTCGRNARNHGNCVRIWHCSRNDQTHATLKRRFGDNPARLSIFRAVKTYKSIALVAIAAT